MALSSLQARPDPVHNGSSRYWQMPSRCILFFVATLLGVAAWLYYSGGSGKNGSHAKTTPETIAATPSAVIASALSVQVRPAPTSSELSATPKLTDIGSPLRDGMSRIADGKLVGGRRILSKLLADGRLTVTDAQTVRDTLTSINRTLIFGDRLVDGDDLGESRTLHKGEYLSNIAIEYKVSFQFLEQINNIDSRRIRDGQKIKCVKGPFHAVVYKSEFRLDVYLKQADGMPIYVCSFPVGVGKADSTPIGAFVIRPHVGKLANPSWAHPRTGQFFTAHDPKNPIGEYWLGLEGTDSNTKDLRGYGIHGTVEPESIGQQMSLGCVRLNANDIEQVYRMLVEAHSTVTIRE